MARPCPRAARRRLLCRAVRVRPTSPLLPGRPLQGVHHGTQFDRNYWVPFLLMVVVGGCWDHSWPQEVQGFPPWTDKSSSPEPGPVAIEPLWGSALSRDCGRSVGSSGRPRWGSAETRVPSTKWLTEIQPGSILIPTYKGITYETCGYIIYGNKAVNKFAFG